MSRFRTFDIYTLYYLLYYFLYHVDSNFVVESRALPVLMNMSVRVLDQIFEVYIDTLWFP